jgi:hypothetical protein
MGPVLGINVAGAVAYCAIVELGVVQESEPFKVEAPAGLASSEGLSVLANDVERLVRERGIARIVVVTPENTHSGTYTALTPRIAVETAILIAGARAGVPADRANRPEIRSRLGIPQSGKLHEHSRAVLPEPGKMWSKKRDVAALGAMSCGRQ